MVKRFVDVKQDVSRVIDASDQDSVKKGIKLCDDMHKFESTYPSFNAIVNCFGPIRHAHKIVEATDTPTLMLVLPLLEELKRKLGFIVNGILDGSNFVRSSFQDKKLATGTIAALNKNQLHDLWPYYCLLHPGLHTL